MHVYTTTHTELAIPHQGRWDGACEKPLPTHPEWELLPFSPQVTLQNHQFQFQDEAQRH